MATSTSTHIPIPFIIIGSPKMWSSSRAGNHFYTHTYFFYHNRFSQGVDLAVGQAGLEPPYCLSNNRAPLAPLWFLRKKAEKEKRRKKKLEGAPATTRLMGAASVTGFYLWQIHPL
jgi:hypothetical protein